MKDPAENGFDWLYPWQVEAPALWEQNQFRGTIQTVPGAGKTIGGLYCLRQKVPKDKKIVIITTTDKVREQWLKIALDFLDGWDYEVMNVQTAYKIRRKVDILVVDEPQETTSPKYKAIYDWEYEGILGLTATPDVGTIKYCGEIIRKVDFDEAHISPFKVIFHGVDMNSNEAWKYVQLSRRLSRLMEDEEQNWDDIEKLCRILIMKRRSVVYQLKARLPKAKALLESFLPKKTLVVCERITQADKLHEIMEDYNPSLYHSQYPDSDGVERFKNGATNLLISVRALKVGFDVPDIEVVLMVSTALSETAHIQTLGRAIRYVENKSAEVHIILGKNTTDETVLGYAYMYPHEIRDGMKPRDPVEHFTDSIKARYYHGDTFGMDYKGRAFKRGDGGRRLYQKRHPIEGKIMQALQHKGGKFKVFGNQVIVKTRESGIFIVVAKIEDPFVEQEDKRSLTDKPLTWEELFEED